MHGQNHIQNLKNISFFCKFLPLLHTLHNCIAFKAASFTSIMLHILSSRYYNDLLDLQLSWTLWNCRKESWNEKYSGCTGHKNTDPLKEMQHTEVIFTISSFFLSFFLSFFISLFPRLFSFFSYSRACLLAIFKPWSMNYKLVTLRNHTAQLSHIYWVGTGRRLVDRRKAVPR